MISAKCFAVVVFGTCSMLFTLTEDMKDGMRIIDANSKRKKKRSKIVQQFVQFIQLHSKLIQLSYKLNNMLKGANSIPPANSIFSPEYCKIIRTFWNWFWQSYLLGVLLPLLPWCYSCTWRWSSITINRMELVMITLSIDFFATGCKQSDGDIRFVHGYFLVVCFHFRLMRVWATIVWRIRTNQWNVRSICLVLLPA